jgi:hypothetical protein
MSSVLGTGDHAGDNHVRPRVVPASCGGSVEGLAVEAAICRHACDDTFRMSQHGRRLNRIIGVALRRHVSGSRPSRHR